MPGVAPLTSSGPGDRQESTGPRVFLDLVFVYAVIGPRLCSDVHSYAGFGADPPGFFALYAEFYAAL